MKNTLKSVSFALKYQAFFLTILLGGAGINVLQAQSSDCSQANQMCPDMGATTYAASTNAGSAAPGNNYGCLGTQPNPAWFFVEVSTAGSAVVFLNNSNNVDIDFAMWGPFPNLNTALGSCGSLGFPTDCSYSPSANEVIVFPASQPGDVYLILITNFSNQPTDITATDPAGSQTIFGCSPPCLADGGTLSSPPISACFGDPSLALNLVPSYGAGGAPPLSDFGYTHLICSPSGTILSYNMGPDMTTTAPGDYLVCGLSYALDDAAFLPTVLGQNVSSLRNALNGSTPLFCGDVSTNCIMVHIGPPIPPTFLPPVEICPGDCITGPDGSDVCNPGTFQFTFTTPDGCDSVVNLTVIPKPPASGIITRFVCEGECLSINGQQVCPPGPVVQTLTARNGCDSILTIILIEIPVDANITPDPPPTLNCSRNMVILSGATSTAGASLNWTNQNNQNLGNGYTLNVMQPGLITLTATYTQGNQICRDSSFVIITGNADPPDISTDDMPEICQGESFDLSNLNITDANNTGGTITFHSASPATLANEINPVVSPNNTTTYYILSTAGNCSGETSVEVVVTPQPDISVADDPEICAGDTVFFNNLTIDDANNANGILSFHTASPANAGNEIADPFWTGNQTTDIFVLSTVGNCSDETSFSITVNPVPSADFTIGSTVCQGDDLTINYTGTAGPGASFTWNFNGGNAVPGAGQGPHTVNWSTQGMKNVTLSVTENGCTSDLFSLMVNVSPPLSTPVINCQEFLDSILFNWNNVNGASDYTTNVLSGQTPTVLSNTNLGFYNLSQGEVVTLEVIAESGNDCPNTVDTLTCIAQNCPTFTVDISPVAAICLDASAGSQNLNVTVAGGAGNGTVTWSGNGITDPDAGTFDPVIAGPGTQTIVASYEEGNCGATGSIDIEIIEQPSAAFSLPDTICLSENIQVNYTGGATAIADYQWEFDNGNATPGTGQGPHTVTWTTPGTKTVSLIVTENNCASEPMNREIQVDRPLDQIVLDCQPDLNTVGFSWNNLQDISGFEVFLNGSSQGIQNNPDFNQAGLQPGDDVAIRVVAISENACPNVQSSLTCTAQDCPNFIIDFGSTPMICLDGNTNPIDLSATVSGGLGNGDLVWSGTGITDTLNGTFDPVISGPGQFTIRASYTEGSCMESETMTVTVNEVPTATFNVQSPICLGDISLSEFTGTAGFNADFQWDFDNGNADPGTGRAPQIVSWDNPGTKTISLTVTENGCTSTLFSQQVEVDEPLAAPVIDCDIASTGINFDWNDVLNSSDYELIVNGDTIGTQANSDYSINGLAPGTSVNLQVTAFSSNSCPPVTTSKNCITEDCPPISAQISSLNTAICEGDTAYLLLNLNAGSNGPFDLVWSADGARDTLNGVNNGFTWVVTPTTTTTYEIHEIINTRFPSCDYPQTGAITVQVNQPRNAGMPGMPLEICATTDTLIELVDLLTGADPGGIWSETSNTPSIGNGFDPATGTFNTTLQVSGTFNFQYTVINAPCPSDEATVTVKLTQFALPGVSKDTLMICQNVLEDVVLNDLIDGESPGGTWTETSVNPTTGGQFDPANGSFSNFDLNPGNYQFTYTVDGEAPCPSRSADVQIGILDLPPVNAGVESPYYLDCNETSVSIGDANNPSGSNFLYEWTDTNNMILGTELFLDAPGAGLYTLFITDTLTGCVNADTTNVVERVSTPIPEISLAPVSCFGDNDGIIQVDTVVGGMGPYLFSLNGSALSSQSNFENLSPAQYTLTVEDAFGCQHSININIEQPENLLLDLVVFVDADGTITLGDSVALNAFVNLEPSDIDSVNWSPPELFDDCDTCLQQIITPLENTNFSVTVISNDGCMASDDYALRVKKEHPVYIPSGFSPNNDGINDFFQIYPSPTVTKVNSFLIFDRWGEVVHEYYEFDPNDSSHAWDGTFRGQALNPNVYTYFAEIEFVDGVVEIFKGDVSIVK